MAMVISIGEAAIDAKPGEPVRVVVAPPDLTKMIPNFATSRDAKTSEWIGLFDRLGGDVAHLFYGSGWQRADRKCREGFHREVPMIPANNAPTTLCWGDVKVLRAAGARAHPLAPADQDVLRWLVESVEAALTSCRHPILTVT